MQDASPTPSRRRFLQASAAIPASLLAGGLILHPGASSLAHAAPLPGDGTTRADFDALDQAFNNGNGYRDETNDKDSSGLGGKLAWGEAYILEGYALMYAAHRDTHYLDKMVDHIDRVLANRDSERGVTDHNGESRPAWRTDNPYTVGYATIPDGRGQPVFEVRSALAYADSCVATVTAGSAPGLFDLDVFNSQSNRRTVHVGLSTDPSSPDYAVDRLVAGFARETPARVLVTVRDLRTPGSQPAEVAPGSYQMEAPGYVFEVHTGQIVQPMVTFARFVKEDPALQANATYRQRAATYLAAAQQAVAVHDREWRENDLGEGYYITLPDAPVWHAGIDNPLNHFLALGRAVLQLAVVTGDPTYAHRAAAMSKTLRGSLTTDENGAYVWPYWWQKGAAYAGWGIDAPLSQYRPWYPPNVVPEDTSHGQIEVNFAIETYRALPQLRPGTRPAFTGAQVEPFAATFVHNVAATEGGRATVKRFVDATGDTGLEAYERQSGAWAGLTAWDGRVLTHLRDMFGTREFALQPSTIYCVARLNHAANVRR